MNVSHMNYTMNLALLVASSALGCNAVDHTVGAEAKDESVIGAAGAGADWSEEIMQECPGSTPEFEGESCGYSKGTSTPHAYSVAIVVDQSAQMAAELGYGSKSRWDAVREGLVELQDEYASVSGSKVSLVFSAPRSADVSSEACTSAAYDVTSFSAADAETGVTNAFRAREPAGDDRPLRPALEAAFAHLQAEPYDVEYGNRNPQPLMVLITAGAPDACSTDDPVEELAAVAKAFNETPIPTYVIEVGSEANLDAVAKAGGSKQAQSISGGDVTAQVEQAVRNALDDSRWGYMCTHYFSIGDNDFTGSEWVLGPDSDHPEAIPWLAGPEDCADSPNGGVYPIEPKVLDGETIPGYQYCPCTCARAAQFDMNYELTLACTE